jgi:hypothetical protein
VDISVDHRDLANAVACLERLEISGRNPRSRCLARCGNSAAHREPPDKPGRADKGRRPYMPEFASTKAL